MTDGTDGAPVDRSGLPAHRNPPEVDRVAAARAAVAARRARAAVKAQVASGERSPLEVARAPGPTPTCPPRSRCASATS